MERPSIGDPVEVRFMTPEGEEWRPGTVASRPQGPLVVAFAGGVRRALSNNDKWRPGKGRKP